MLDFPGFGAIVKISKIPNIFAGVCILPNNHSGEQEYCADGQGEYSHDLRVSNVVDVFADVPAKWRVKAMAVRIYVEFQCLPGQKMFSEINPILPKPTSLGNMYFDIFPT